MGRSGKLHVNSGVKGEQQSSLFESETEAAIEKAISEALSGSKTMQNGVDYNLAKSGKVGRVDSISETTDHSVPMSRGKPNSVVKVTRNGRVEKERYYDEKGNAYYDIDYTDHGNPKTHKIVPHGHQITWDKGVPTRHKGEKIGGDK